MVLVVRCKVPGGPAKKDLAIGFVSFKGLPAKLFVLQNLLGPGSKKIVCVSSDARDISA